MGAVPEATGWLFGLSFVHSVLLLAVCILLPIVAFKIYQQANSSFRLPNRSRKRILVPDVHYPYGYEEIQGRRNYMEDRHVEAGNIGGDPNASFYAVFDGHGGSAAADFCVSTMVYNLKSYANVLENPHKALTHAFLETDRQFLEVARRHKLDDGTTACAALVIGKRMIVANAGDTRAVIVQRQGRVVPMSFDHKPNREDERRRIRSLGGSVFLVGVWRVEGVLAVSRAIGDRALKRYVTSLPDIVEREISGRDRYLVICSDGLFDVMGNEELAEMTYKSASAQAAATLLVECAYSRGSSDNITALVIDITSPSAARAVGRASSNNKEA